MSFDFCSFKNLDYERDLKERSRNSSVMSGFKKCNPDSIFSEQPGFKSRPVSKGPVDFKSPEIFRKQSNVDSLNKSKSGTDSFLKKTCNLENIANTMIKMIDLKDAYTGEHSQCVQKHSETFAKKLGLSESETELIRLGARFHDIGKIGVPESILNSKKALSDDEYETMKKHPEHGAKILEDIPAFKGTVSDIVKQHHENWDGSGYPNKLSGEEIHIGARIVSIVDSFHAMTSDRPYRKGMPKKEAFNRLKEGAGKQWDPALVDKFIETNTFSFPNIF